MAAGEAVNEHGVGGEGAAAILSCWVYGFLHDFGEDFAAAMEAGEENLKPEEAVVVMILAEEEAVVAEEVVEVTLEMQVVVVIENLYHLVSEIEQEKRTS